MEYFSCSESVDSSVTIRKKDCTARHGNLRLAFRRKSISAAIELATGGAAQPHVGTGGGGSTSESPVFYPVYILGGGYTLLFLEQATEVLRIIKAQIVGCD